MGDHDNQQVNPKKLFVGSLPFRTTEEELREIFSQYGEVVSVKLITDRATGRSKGIAFVEYSTEEEAQAAIEAVHGSELDGRTLVVNVARPQAPRERRDFGGGFRSDNGGFRGGYRGGNDRGGRNDRRGGGYGGGRSF